MIYETLKVTQPGVVRYTHVYIMFGQIESSVFVSKKLNKKLFENLEK
jgi:hypothetical protein